MNRLDMYIGQRVRIPAKDIVRYISTDQADDNAPLKKVIRHQKEKVLYVRELHNEQVAGLSSSMDTPAERSIGILYNCIEPYEA